MSVTYRKNSRAALEIDADFLRRIHAVLSEFANGSAVDMTLATRDNITLRTDSIDELLTGELIETDHIHSVEFHARVGHVESASFEITTDGGYRTHTVSLNTEHPDKIRIFRSRLKDLVASATPWYSIFRFDTPGLSVFTNFMFGVITIATGVGVLIYLGLLTANPVSLSIGFTFNIAAVCLIISFLQKALYPGVVFKMGKSGRRATKIEKFRKHLFITVLLGLAVSVLGTFLYERGTSSATQARPIESSSTSQ